MGKARNTPGGPRKNYPPADPNRQRVMLLRDGKRRMVWLTTGQVEDLEDPNLVAPAPLAPLNQSNPEQS